LERVPPDSPAGLVTISCGRRAAGFVATLRYRLKDRGVLKFVYLSPDMPRVRERDLAALIENGAVPCRDPELEQIIRRGTRPIRRERSL
jgi:hypothetical protein